MLDACGREKRLRELMDGVRADLCRSSQLEWDALTATAGVEILYHCWISNELTRTTTILPPIGEARRQIYPKRGDAHLMFDYADTLYRAEEGFSSVLEGEGGCMDTTIKYPLAGRYSFSQMAMDQEASLGREVPRILTAAWNVARCAGRWWWPFFGCVVLSGRPAEIRVNERSLLHSADGPALRYRDGTTVWAWSGVRISGDWMLHPERIPAAAFGGYDSSLRKYVRSRVGTPRRQARLKPSAILKKALPTDPAGRVELLRGHNAGRLPLFDRYMGGEYRKVWEELIALGPSVREDPHAADALAVAYETMRRVDGNVRTLAARLTGIGYRFKQAKPHQPPDPRKAPKQIARLEKAAGALPLSLRAFYDVVGAVNLIGEHPAIAPPGNNIAPDPLVVYSAGDALEQVDDEREDMDDHQSIIVIAPDDLHKADTSGGEPYEIAVPDLRADGPLLWERHGLGFVEYLRLAFRFGGFPGYEGIDPVPAELNSLSQGLTPF